MEISPERRRYAPSTVGTLRGFLLGLQGFTTVMHELLQNAEDAQATEFYVKFTPEALWVGNNAVFEDDHFQALSNPAAGSKRHDVEQIGSFGIGFTSVYQLTDSPQVMSRGQRYTLFPLEDTVEIAHDVEHGWATAIRLPWAFERTAVREALDSDPLRPEQLPGFIADARAALIRSAVFLKHIDRLLLADGSGVIEDILITRQAGRRTVATLAEQFTYRMYPVTVDDQTVHHLIEQGERQGQVMLAVPEESQEHFQGYFYASLPTQERTFLPFHLDANFYPHSDRKSLLWDGNDSSKQRWNLAVLRAARQALPAILEDLRSSGAAPLYAFALACLSAPDQAGQSRAGPWVKDCAQTVRNTFRERPLLLSERAGWVVEERLTIPVQGLELAVDLQQRLESRTAWVFPPSGHIVAFQALFQALALRVLSAECFISVLPALFKDTADLPAGVHAWEVVQPAVTYLRLALARSAHPEKTIERHAEKLSGLPFAVNQAGDLTALKDVWHIESGWSDILETWCDEQLILAKEWAAEAENHLLSLAKILTPDDLINTLREWPHEDIQGKLRSRDVLHRLYEFLGSASFHKNNARELPICLGRDGQFYPANRVVLSGEIKDPFGCLIELDQEMEKKFRTFFASLGLDPLDGDFYYKKLLPDLARTSRDQREAILKHLAITRHLKPDRQAIWREVPMVQTIQGDWVKPSRASFEHPLLEQLFKSTYHAVARDLADNKEVKKFLKKLGVESTPTPEKLAAIVKERQNEPINEASLAWRGELVKHALKDPEVLEHLKDIAWLPSVALTRWLPAQQLWHPERRILVGQEREANRDFIGLKMSLDDAQTLGVSEPIVETVLRHLSALHDHRKPLPVEALAWLEHQTLDEEHVVKLQKLPLFLTINERYREPTYFFIGKHQLAPYRGVLSEKYSEAYPELMKQLGVKQHPEAQDFAEVLQEIATTVPDGGKVKPEVAQLVKFCLNECAKSWKPKEPEPTWMNRLRQLRVVPVGKKEDLRVLKPRDALRNDLPESELERYDLREAKAYFVHEVSNTGFLKALGIRGLRDVMQVRLVSTADQGTPSSYTQLLRSLLPAILRYLHHLNEHKSPEKLQEEVLRWRFVTLKAIEAAISFPQFNFIRSRRVQLKHEIDLERNAILLEQQPTRFDPGMALSRALNVKADSQLPALLSMTLPEANDLLDSLKIPSLPETFTPDASFGVAEAVDPSGLPAASRPEMGGTNGVSPLETRQRAEEAMRPSSPHPTTSDKRPNATAAFDHPEGPQAPPTGASEDRRSHLPSESTQSVSVSALTPDPDTNPALRSGISDDPNFSFPSAQQLREQLQRSAANAAGRKDHTPTGAGKSFTEPKRQPMRKANGSKVRRSQARFRNYVHVSPEKVNEAEHNISEHNKTMDSIGMKVVSQFETLAGRTPRDYSDEPEGGYDIRSEGLGEIRLIEVKTLSGPWGARGVTVSRKQMSTAFARDDRFWLYVVECASTQPRLWCIRNPAWVATSYTFADDWADERFAEGPFVLV